LRSFLPPPLLSKDGNIVGTSSSAAFSGWPGLLDFFLGEEFMEAWRYLIFCSRGFCDLDDQVGKSLGDLDFKESLLGGLVNFLDFGISNGGDL
jgi:hypothetical protein